MEASDFSKRSTGDFVKTVPSIGPGKLRICVTTSYGATEEPRGPRYAAELARIDPSIEVTFVDCVPRGRKALPSVEFANLTNLTFKSWHFPWRGGGTLPLLIEKVRQKLAKLSFGLGGTPRTAGLSTRSIGLERLLVAEKADLYFGFNIDTILPVYNAARAAGVPFMFDCHEIHAEMAYDQSEAERNLIRAVQHLCLPSCALVLAASPQAAAFIERDFGIKNVLSLLNAAPLEDVPPNEGPDEFTLYWRNSTVDLGLRGLGDALLAMPLLPEGIKLVLQGRPAPNGTDRVEQLIRELGIGKRVAILPPYLLKDAVKAAVPYTVGLSLESPASMNMDLTSTNKFFEYAMAGLAIVGSRTAGMKDLFTENKLGLLYEHGDHADLARQILRLYEDRELLAQMRRSAREYALREGNLEFQMIRFRDTFRQRVLPLLEAQAGHAEAAVQ